MAAPLSTLRDKLRRRKSARERQAKLYRKNRRRGHAKAVRTHNGAIAKLRKLIKRAVLRRPESGTGPWQGCQSIATNEIIPIGRKWGIPVTSRKRSETYGNPSSDHYFGNTNAYAVDFGTDSNYAFGAAIGDALGVPYNGAGDDYAEHIISRAGRQFRIEIVCGTHGTGPHTHVGIRRV
jgi:hypothetical protein